MLRQKITDLAQSHGSSLTGFLANLLGDYERARDLAQESYLKLYRYLDSKRSESETDKRELHPLLFKIALNLGRDEIRRRKVRKEQSLVVDVAEVVEEKPDLVELAEKKRVIHEALDLVSPRFREILILRDIDGRSYVDIANILEIEMGTVKSRINRARMEFKSIYLKLKRVE